MRANKTPRSYYYARHETNVDSSADPVTYKSPQLVQASIYMFFADLDRNISLIQPEVSRNRPGTKVAIIAHYRISKKILMKPTPISYVAMFYFRAIADYTARANMATIPNQSVVADEGITTYIAWTSYYSVFQNPDSLFHKDVSLYYCRW